MTTFKTDSHIVDFKVNSFNINDSYFYDYDVEIFGSYSKLIAAGIYEVIVDASIQDSLNKDHDFSVEFNIINREVANVKLFGIFSSLSVNEDLFKEFVDQLKKNITIVVTTIES